MVGANVEGLPIPNSSNFFTNAASEYRYGGLENRCVETKDFRSTKSPLFTAGSIPSASSSSSSIPSK